MAVNFRKTEEGSGSEWKVVFVLEMKYMILLMILLTGLAFGEESKLQTTVAPKISLFVVHDKQPKGGLEVVTPSKSSKGFIAHTPDIELPNFLEVFHQAPKVLKRTSEGDMIFVNGDADLLLSLHEQETNKLTVLHKKVGDVRLYIKVTIGKSSRYFDAEFAPVSDSAFFVEGTAEEKAELAKLLQLLVTDAKKEN